MPTDPTKGCPFPGLSYAGPMDDVKAMDLEIPMSESWLGYLNERLMMELQRLHPNHPLRYVQFVPDVAGAQTMIVPAADEHAYGAVKVEYSPTENNATINMRTAVQAHRLPVLKGRTRVFQVTFRKGSDGKEYLAVMINDRESRPAQKRKAPDVVPAAVGEGSTGSGA